MQSLGKFIACSAANKIPRFDCQVVGQFSTSHHSQGKEKFERTQKNVNIVTLGGHQHGKTWLASELSRVLAAQEDGVSHKMVEMIDHSSTERDNRRSEHASHLELWRRGSGLRFTLADLPGHSSYLKNTVNFMAHADVGLLVISPELGVDDTTRLYCQLASHLGVGLIIPVTVPRPNTDEETVDLIRMEVSELEGVEELEIVSEESLIALLEKVENHDTTKSVLGKREKDKPLLMAVEQAGNIPSRGVFCAGRVLQGEMTPGGGLEVFCQGKSSKISVREMEIFRKVADTLQAGDRGGAFVKMKPEIDLKRGAVIYDPKLKISPRDELEVSLVSVSGEKAIKGDSVLFHSTSTDGKVPVPGGNIEISDSKETPLKMKLSQKILARPSDKFILRNNQNFFKGVVLN